MRSIIMAAAAAIIAGTAAVPAVQAQEDPDLPGVRVTIQKRSYLDAGRVVRPRAAADYSGSVLYSSPFQSSNYNGIAGFQSFPLPDAGYIPGAQPIEVDFRAPASMAAGR